MIVAGFAFRYEPQWMIDDLMENLSWVDNFAIHDDRKSGKVWSPSRQRNTKVRQKAKKMGATWMLFTAPDERWDIRAQEVIEPAIKNNPNARFQFPLREMWSPLEYRVDGTWATKQRVRLTRVDIEVTRRPAELLDVPIYHLKMIEEANRLERVRVHKKYNTWDNRGKGFDYLGDETDLALEPIGEGYGYRPAYRPYQFLVSE